VLLHQPWCYYLRHLNEDIEKSHAFHGLCLAIHQNPRGILPAFRLLVEAIHSWQQPSSDLQAMFRSLLNGFKASLGAQWPTFYNQCDQPTRDAISHIYGV
jgi:transportin-1